MEIDGGGAVCYGTRQVASRPCGDGHSLRKVLLLLVFDLCRFNFIDTRVAGWVSRGKISTLRVRNEYVARLLQLPLRERLHVGINSAGRRLSVPRWENCFEHAFDLVLLFTFFLQTCFTGHLADADYVGRLHYEIGIGVVVAR